MHRFYLPPEDCKSTDLFLSGRESHHALHVLRVRRGDEVVVLDGEGTELLCEVRDASKNIQVAVVKKISVAASPCRITLLQAVPKGKIIETIIQKATELGVHRIVPLLTERVATRLDDTDVVRKAEKWQMVAVEAIKQCGFPWLPKVEAPVTLEKFLARQEKFELPLIASLQPGSIHARAHFASFKNREGRPPESVCIWIGPEGDFTSAEVIAVEKAGALPITLGPRVLRVETAAVYCLSILNYELQAA